mmetsp:Transcript_52220/g.113779  ORF Transcript_52220/g.113779 Transcript_52220/m.113779 type:complete len:253 (-) Transcript_52220:1385-2143(-)
MPSTTVFVRLSVASFTWNPICGMGIICPSWPSSLLEESARIFNLGKTKRMSAANCSPTQRLTSHPMMSRSIESSASPRCRFSRRCRSLLVNVHAVMRLSDSWLGSAKSSLMARNRSGSSRMSRPIGSATVISGSGSTSGLPANCSLRDCSGWCQLFSKKLAPERTKLLSWPYRKISASFVSASLPDAEVPRDAARRLLSTSASFSPQRSSKTSPTTSSRSNLNEPALSSSDSPRPTLVAADSEPNITKPALG